MANDLETLASSNFDYQNFFSAQLTADLTDSATDIFLDTIPTPSEGVLVLDWDVPGSREAIFYTSKTASKVTCHANGRGFDSTSAIAHTTGAKVIMAPIADWFRYIKAIATTSPTGWKDVGQTVSYNANSGDKVYSVDVAADVTAAISKGMKLKVTRDTTAPTTSHDFESTSTQYASITDAAQTGLDITGDISIEAWVKMESNTTASQYIAAKYDSGSTQSGYLLRFDADGGLVFQYNSTGSASPKESRHVGGILDMAIRGWTHVAVTADVSASEIKTYVNGKEYTGTDTSITGCTSIFDNTAAFGIGYVNAAGGLFDGKIADLRVWNDVRTATEIRDNMNKQLVGNEAGLVGYWKLDSDLTDSTANGNDLTQSGGVSTATDHPFNDIEYAKITDVSESGGVTTLTLDTGKDHNIPDMTLTTPQYSISENPYGWPQDFDKRGWTIWEPTWKDLTVGNGYQAHYYKQEGTTVTCRGWVKLGSTSSVSLSISIDFPVTPASEYVDTALPRMQLGEATFYDDSAPANHLGVIQNFGDNVSIMARNTTTSNYVYAQSLNTTIPFTWATNDLITYEFVYEAATAV